jgi:hypothetical protein
MNDYQESNRKRWLESSKREHLGDKIERILLVLVVIYFGGHLLYALYASKTL